MSKNHLCDHYNQQCLQDHHSSNNPSVDFHWDHPEKIVNRNYFFEFDVLSVKQYKMCLLEFCPQKPWFIYFD